jgi:hypothetical protein
MDIQGYFGKVVYARNGHGRLPPVMALFLAVRRLVYFKAIMIKISEKRKM